MSQETVTWKTEKDGVAISGEFLFDHPDTLAEAEERYGETTVVLGLKKSVNIYLQAYARRQATKEENPMSPAEIAKAIPGLKITFSEREVIDPVDKILAQFGKVSEEKRAQLLASLQEMVA